MNFKITLFIIGISSVLSCKKTPCPSTVEKTITFSDEAKEFYPFFNFNKLHFISASEELVFYKDNDIERFVSGDSYRRKCESGDYQNVITTKEEFLSRFKNENEQTFSFSLKNKTTTDIFQFGYTELALKFLDYSSGIWVFPFPDEPLLDTLYSPITDKEYYDVYRAGDFLINKQYGVVAFGDFALVKVE